MQIIKSDKFSKLNYDPETKNTILYHKFLTMARLNSAAEELLTKWQDENRNKTPFVIIKICENKSKEELKLKYLENLSANTPQITIQRVATVNQKILRKIKAEKKTVTQDHTIDIDKRATTASKKIKEQRVMSKKEVEELELKIQYNRPEILGFASNNYYEALEEELNLMELDLPAKTDQVDQLNKQVMSLKEEMSKLEMRQMKEAEDYNKKNKESLTRIHQLEQENQLLHNSSMQLIAKVDPKTLIVKNEDKTSESTESTIEDVIDPIIDEKIVERMFKNFNSFSSYFLDMVDKVDNVYMVYTGFRKKGVRQLICEKMNKLMDKPGLTKQQLWSKMEQQLQNMVNPGDK